MIIFFKNIRERRDRAKFLCLGYKTNNRHIKKNAARKWQLDKILGLRSGPHIRRLCIFVFSLFYYSRIVFFVLQSPRIVLVMNSTVCQTISEFFCLLISSLCYSSVVIFYSNKCVCR